MGKLLIGHYGSEPEAESMAITLRECHQRLGMRPSDFISCDPPDIFKKAHGAKGKYLVFRISAEEIRGNVMWREGYYLLPLEAADVLKVFQKEDGPGAIRMGSIRPMDILIKTQPPADVLERARQWGEDVQPLFFQCRCPRLILRVDAPWALRRRWKTRLTCPQRCQPALKAEV
jgi:hypothetical protein